MYVLMEEFTNLCNYPIPKDTRLVKNIIAENDGYVIRAGVPTMQQVWPGTTVEVSEKLQISDFLWTLDRSTFHNITLLFLNDSSWLFQKSPPELELIRL